MHSQSKTITMTLLSQLRSTSAARHPKACRSEGLLLQCRTPHHKHQQQRRRPQPVAAVAQQQQQQQQQQQPSLQLEQLQQATQVRLATSSSCRLAVSRYPTFSYNAAGGGGVGAVQQLDGQPNKLALTFDASKLLIPDLNYKTAAVLGLPIPPPLNIAIKPRRFEGVLDLDTGCCEMEFDAEFCFTAGSLYTAPPLQVVTTLTSECSSGEIHNARGQRYNTQDGTATLVGVARVPRVARDQDWFLNAFLMLPTDALAVMAATLEFS